MQLLFSTLGNFHIGDTSMKGLESLFLLTGLVCLIVIAAPAIGNPGKFSHAIQYLETGKTSQQQADNSYSVLGSPSLSATFINHILTIANSPANGQGDSFYSNSVKYGINDPFPLAFFNNDQTFAIYAD